MSVKKQIIKHIAIIGVLVMNNSVCFGQQEYTLVKNRFCNNAEVNSERLNTEDDLSFIISPLTELELDKDYVLSDFRKKWTPPSGWLKDVSSLWLYVRDKKIETGSVPYIWPFDKISLSGTQMSIWQAYLLDCSKTMFGMRNEANYSKEYLITSVEDVDSILSIICNLWESYNLQNKDDTTKIKGHKAIHVSDAITLTDSLKSIRTKMLAPVFTYHEDSVTIEHYSFFEFSGLARCTATLLLSENRKKIKAFGQKSREVIAKYRHLVYF